MTAPGAGQATTGTASAGYIYRGGRYTALAGLDGMPTGQYGINDSGQILLPTPGILFVARNVSISS